MNKQLFFLLTLHLLLLNNTQASLGENNTKKTSTASQKSTEKLLWFRFKDEPIANIIDYLATEKGINILPPQGPNALTAKLTFELPYKISVDKAWNTLLAILDLSGYTFIPHKDHNYIVKNDANTNKESLPIYINTKRDDLPNSYIRIRYIRYLENLQIGSSGGNPLRQILSDFLSADAGGSLIFEPLLNAVIITDRSIMIKTALEVIDALESSTAKQTLKIIPLTYTVAADIKALFDQLISGASGSSGAPTAMVNGTANYFEKTTKIIAEPRTNRLILVGKADALERIETFIKTSIDIPTELGESVLHIYPLKYLDAGTFSQTLQKIVTDSSSSGSSGGGYGSGSGQSTSTSTNLGSVTQYFTGVIITTENANGGQASGATAGNVSQTGNRLIIAATKNDWIRLEKLIQELDIAQPQVAIKCLIVDLSSSGAKALGSQIRNRQDAFPNGVSAQAAHLAPITSTGPNLVDSVNNTLAGNLMNSTGTSNLAGSASTNASIITVTDPTSTIPNDIWLITRILNSSQDNQILSQPFGFGTNNQQIVFTSTETRILDGTASSQQGTTVINKVPVAASISITLTPRISRNNTMNIQIIINVNQWISGGDDQNNRNITTNINMKSGEICFLSGLGKRQISTSKNETPLLSKIPILGSLFFSDKTNNKTTTDLCIFLQAEVIQPRHDFDPYTREKFTETVESLFASENFENLRDPVTRWFFGEDTGLTEQWQGFKERPQQTTRTRNNVQLEPMITSDKKNNISEEEVRAAEKIKKMATDASPNLEEILNKEFNNAAKVVTDQRLKSEFANVTDPADKIIAGQEESGLENSIAIKLDEDYSDPLNPFGPHVKEAEAGY